MINSHINIKCIIVFAMLGNGWRLPHIDMSPKDGHWVGDHASLSDLNKVHWQLISPPPRRYANNNLYSLKSIVLVSLQDND